MFGGVITTPINYPYKEAANAVFIKLKTTKSFLVILWLTDFKSFDLKYFLKKAGWEQKSDWLYPTHFSGQQKVCCWFVFFLVLLYRCF